MVCRSLSSQCFREWKLPHTIIVSLMFSNQVVLSIYHPCFISGVMTICHPYFISVVMTICHPYFISVVMTIYHPCFISVVMTICHPCFISVVMTICHPCFISVVRRSLWAASTHVTLVLLLNQITTDNFHQLYHISVITESDSHGQLSPAVLYQCCY